MIPGLLAGMLALSAAAAPAEKDGTWIEVKSSDFVVLTDAGTSAARRAILRFETIRAALATFMPSVRLSGERELLVIVPRDQKSLRSLIPGWWAEKDGMRPSTLYLSDRDHMFILVRADLRADDEEAFRAAHWGLMSHLISLNTTRLPLWAQRGLADLYARTTVHENRLSVGRAPEAYVRTLREGVLMPMRDLWAVDQESLDSLGRERRLDFDVESWVLVHYLLLGDDGAHRDNMARFLTLLNEDRTMNDAAREAFGDSRAFETALASYVQAQALYARATSAEMDVPMDTIPERPLSSAEALTMRAAVHLASERYDDADALLDEALRLDPKLAWAYETRAALAWEEEDPVAAREAVAQALSLEPGRPLATRLQGRVSGPPTLEGAERLCDAGDLVACDQLGGWLIDGDGTTPDPSRGVELMERACSGGNAPACLRLSWRFRQGTGVPADQAQAGAFLEKACAAGDSQSCLAAASGHEASDDAPVDAAGSARMLDMACSQGERTACVALAWALQNGDGVTRDLERAAGLYQDGCDGGDAVSCTRLGILYAMPGLLPTDHARARELLTKGCDLGDRVGCSNLDMLTALTE